MTIQKDLVPITQLISLKGKTAIVTGGAQGIGHGIAYRLAEAGAMAVIADANKDKGDEAARQLAAQGFQVRAFRCDVTNEAEIKSLVEDTVQALGGIDILVNNAGIFPFKPTDETSGEDFLRVMDVNLQGAFLCSREVARRMAERGRGGCIINIASVDALHPSSKGLAAYDSSKGGLWMLTKSLASEFSSHKIRVNAIAPGGVMTEGTRVAMTQGYGGPATDMRAWLKAFMARTALKRMGVPDEIGRVALFLASDLSAYMTGSLVVVDGGMLVS